MKNKVYYGEYSLKHWIDLMLSENIILPDYQRSFAWDEKDVKRLIDTFTNNQFVPPVTIGVYTKSNGKENLILDGQQRLTSILLAYLGIIPIKDRFEKAGNSNANQESESNSSTSSDTVIKWRFSALLNFGNKRDDIVNNIKSDNIAQDYRSIDFTIDDDFLNSHYLGFSLLIPDESEQKNYFASTFIDINSHGKELGSMEIREALYYLDENLKEFFSPKYNAGYIVQPKSYAYKMDFVKYLSMISQYIHEGQNVKNIAIGTRRKQEALENGYFLPYIQSIIQNKESDIWGKYSKISTVFPNNSWEGRISKLGVYLEKLLGGRYTFKSIIDIDMHLFGLVYYIIFENREIRDDKINELKDKILNESKNLQNDKQQSKSPNQLQHIRNRIEKSIEIYEEFIL